MACKYLYEMIAWMNIVLPFHGTGENVTKKIAVVP